MRFWLPSYEHTNFNQRVELPFENNQEDDIDYASEEDNIIVDGVDTETGEVISD